MANEEFNNQTEQLEQNVEHFSHRKHPGTFTGKIGFVLAASGSAVGLGNLWRFPYLAAEYGGGVFIFCYLLLAAFFGVMLLMLEIAIGRYTGMSVIGAFKKLSSKFKWFGYFCVIIPILIVPYYCVVGGWVLKYAFAFLIGQEGLGTSTTIDTGAMFTNFISSPIEPLIFFLVFALITVVIVVFGIQKGIEKISKILMPLLAIMSVGLMIYVMCQPNAGEGIKYILIPNFENFSFKTVLAALGQLFYSMSIGMCIMITYGAYMKKNVSIKSSSAQIAIFDSAFAIIASLIVVPAIFAFNPEGAQEAVGSSGASLMFIQLTNVFHKIGVAGRVIGVIFFLLVFFAAVTSSLSLVESIVAVICESGKIKRFTACAIVFGAILVFGVLSSLSFGPLANITFFGKNIFDSFDYLANNILLPISTIITCVICGWFIEKSIIPKEIGIENKKYQCAYFNIIIKYVAPVCILLILITGLFIQL